MLAISLVLKAWYSPLRSTMRRLMVGGSCLRLAFSVEERLSMPLVRKPSILRRRVLSVVASRFAARPVVLADCESIIPALGWGFLPSRTRKRSRSAVFSCSHTPSMCQILK